MNGRIVIVGAGHAAVRFCEEMRGHGFAGSLIMISEETHRPYERPPLSKAILCSNSGPEHHLLLTEVQQASLAIDWRGGCRAMVIDRSARQVHLTDGTALAYDYLVLATGAAPRRLDCRGAELGGVHYLGNADQALQLRAAMMAAPQSVIVIGGGFIGLEVAAAARHHGHGVTVIENAARCAGRLLPPSLSAELTDLHHRNGVTIRTGGNVTQIIGGHRTEAVQLGSGELLPADLIVVGIGSRPQTELAEGCGLAADNGILVDSNGRTSDPHILAIGDVAAIKGSDGSAPQRRESWDNAQGTAQRAAAAIMSVEQPDPAPPWFWTDQYYCNLQFIGQVTDDCDEQVIERDGGGRVYLYERHGTLVAAGLINAGRDRRRLLKAVGNCEEVDAVKAGFAGPSLKLAS